MWKVLTYLPHQQCSLYFFFFSSRRRHTRCLSDWSSDVSSSDLDIRALPLRAGVFGAEPWTASMRKRIESASGIQAFDIYGLSEIIGPGVAVECPHQDGLHIFEDHFYPEIVDPETGRVLPEGEE